MSCFHHHDCDSVGTCKSCGKNLCPECAVDQGKGLACRGHCEEDVRALIGLIDNNIRLSSRIDQTLESGRRSRSSAAGFNLVTGFVFIGWGLSDPARVEFLIILGACFLAYGAFGLVRVLRLSNGSPKR